MSRPVFAQSVLLPRLLAAIGAGSLLAAPGCGGKTKDASADEAANAIDGEETTKEQATRTTKETDPTNTNPTTTMGQTTNFTPTDVPLPPPTVTGTSPTQPAHSNIPTNTATATTGPTGPTATISMSSPTTEPATTPIDGGATTAEPTVTPADAGTVDASSTTETPTYQCEFGEPQSFCIGAEQMEDQARWGVGDQLRTEPLRSDDEIATGWLENGCMKHEWIASGCCNPALGKGVPQQDGTCCYVACEGACCGRPLIVNGVAVVADVVTRADWRASPSEVCAAVADLSALEREALASAWLADAQMEHASIASFSQFALDLLQLGAPPELVRDCHLAALDEIEHARVGFAVASQLTGMDYGPANLTIGNLKAHSLAEALSAAIVEGCVGETLASGIVAEQARLCTQPELAAQLTKIADDELRHSELAWRFVAWALQRFGSEARLVAQAAFAKALATLPQAPPESGMRAELLHVAGRLTSSEWQRTVEHVARDVIRPAVAALVGDGRSFSTTAAATSSTAAASSAPAITAPAATSTSAVRPG